MCKRGQNLEKRNTDLDTNKTILYCLVAAQSHPFSEDKQCSAWPVPGWETLGNTRSLANGV